MVNRKARPHAGYSLNLRLLTEPKKALCWTAADGLASDCNSSTSAGHRANGSQYGGTFDKEEVRLTFRELSLVHSIGIEM